MVLQQNFISAELLLCITIHSTARSRYKV
jgi:hypothetical protein